MCVDDPSFQAEFVSLDTRIEQLNTVLPALDSISAGRTRSQQLRELLIIYTLCHAAKLQLHARFEPSWDVDRSKALNAAISAGQLLQTVHVGHLKFVDPLMGVRCVLFSILLIIFVICSPSYPSALFSFVSPRSFCY